MEGSWGGGGRHPVKCSPCEHSGVCTDCPRRRHHSGTTATRRNWKRQKPEVGLRPMAILASMFDVHSGQPGRKGRPEGVVATRRRSSLLQVGVRGAAGERQHEQKDRGPLGTVGIHTQTVKWSPCEHSVSCRLPAPLKPLYCAAAKLEKTEAGGQTRLCCTRMNYNNNNNNHNYAHTHGPVLRGHPRSATNATQFDAALCLVAQSHSPPCSSSSPQSKAHTSPRDTPSCCSSHNRVSTPRYAGCRATTPSLRLHRGGGTWRAD